MRNRKEVCDTENWYEEDGRIIMTDDGGKTVAEVVFPDVAPGLADIRHTYVDASFRGRGIAGRLMESAAIRLRQENKRAILSCPYARQWFEGHPKYHDIPVEAAEKA